MGSLIPCVRVIEKGVKYTGDLDFFDHVGIQRVVLTRVEVDGTLLGEIEELPYGEFSRIKVLLISEAYRLYPELVPK